MKAHYSDEKLLSQVLVFETTCFKTSTKLIFLNFFAKGSWNKVVQNPKNKIVKKSHLGTFIVGVHKRNVSPQNHSQNTTLNDHYIYEIIY